MKIKLTNEEIRKSLEIPSTSFPKYVSQIINLANQNAQGTRPRVVGQLTDLIQKFSDGKKLYLATFEFISGEYGQIFKKVKGDGSNIG